MAPQIDVNIVKEGRILRAVKGYDSYQWLKCYNGQYALLNGFSEDSLNAPESGHYAVEIRQATCMDSSICIEVFETNISDLNIKTVHFYPNPAESFVHIESDRVIVGVELIAADGRRYVVEVIPGMLLNIELGEFESGIYTLVLRLSDKEFIMRQLSVLR